MRTVFKKNDGLRLKIIEVFGTQEKCSAISGIHEGTISKLVRGIKSPTDFQKRTLARYLKVKAEEIFPEEEMKVTER